MMDEKEAKAYYHTRLAEMPVDVLERAVRVLQTHLPDEVKEQVRGFYREHGEHNWIHKGIPGGHFGWGMAVRNLLRQEGLKDDLLPAGNQNWDDYYIQVIEVALDLRPRPERTESQ